MTDQDPGPRGASKTWESVRAAARPGPAFSNGTEWDGWAAAHCYVCVHDSDLSGSGCPIAGVAIIEQVTPVEWVEEHPYSLGDRYRCTDFDRDPGVPAGPAHLEVGRITVVPPSGGGA